MALAPTVVPRTHGDRHAILTLPTPKGTKQHLTRKMLSLAQEEAQRFQHNYIGTEHILLGLVRQGDSTAGRVLNRLGVELNSVRDAVEFIIGRGDRIVLGEIGLTPRAKKVIELAVDEARRVEHEYVETEHILLGLVREGQGIAAGVLESLGVKVRVGNTFRPQAHGTIVGPTGKQRSGATAITVRRHLALITVESRHLFGASENVGQIFALAARAGSTPVAVCSSSGYHLAFMVEEHMAASVIALLQHDRENWQVTSKGGLAACACIGSGFTSSPMSPAHAVAALARKHLTVITQGASDLGIILIVEDRDSERALRLLHRDLIVPVIQLVRHHAQEATIQKQFVLFLSWEKPIKLLMSFSDYR